MSKDSKEHYQKVLTIRNQAIEKVMQAKGSYIERGGNDELIIAMYDLEIEFLQKTLMHIRNN